MCVCVCEVKVYTHIRKRDVHKHTCMFVRVGEVVQRFGRKIEITERQTDRQRVRVKVRGREICNHIPIQVVTHVYTATCV